MTKEEQDKIVEENMWLVDYVARKYKNQADWSDMVSAGRYGLMRGVGKYDPDRGKSSTYLIHWVRAEILKCLYEDRNVHLPWNKINKYMKDREKTRFNDGIYPRFEISLDRDYKENLGDDDGQIDSNGYAVEFKSSLSSDFVNQIEDKEKNDHIMYVFEQSDLSDMERQVLIHRFGLYGEDKKTLKEIGDIIGYTPMGVQKIEKKSLKKLSKDKKIAILK